jgi:glyoxylase-like metal-dependent hydrolase (beta-lactamase superfamily II)
MRRTALLAMLIAVGGLSITVSTVQRQRERPDLPAIKQVQGNLYVIQGGDPTTPTFSGGNVAVFVTEAHGVVVVDSKLPGYGQQIIDQIRTVTDKPITTMLHSHVHNDHSGSTPEFPQPIDVITHENIKAIWSQAECEGPVNCGDFKGDGARYLPKRTFSERMSLFEGNDRIELYHFGRGHTNTDTFIVFPSVRVMHSGDLFAMKRPPFIDTNNGGSGLAFPETLGKAVAGISGVDTIIPGHAAELFTWADLEQYAKFLRDFVAMAKEARAAGKTAAQAANDYVIPAKFERYTRSGPRTVQTDIQVIYDELTQ